MPALQVREFPDELYEELRAYAARNHRSIAQQTIACVENEMKRSKALEAQYGDDASWIDGMPIPANIREASARARFVNPFSWFDAVEIEPEEVINARRAKREKLQREIAEFNRLYPMPEVSCDEIVQMIREDRDARTDRIMENIEQAVASKKGFSHDGD